MSVDVDKPIQLQERSVIRKGLTGLRSDGMVPAVIHNHGQPSLHVMGDELELGKLYQAAGKHHPLELHIGSQNFLALIKDVHFHPARRQMQHVVFQAIKRDEKVEAEVPIRLEGEVPAEKVGLMLLHQLDHVEVEALPKNLPDELVVDATNLAELQDKVSVADLVVPEGVTILTDSEHPIATVVESRQQISEAEEAAAEEEVAEGEEPVEGAEGEAAEGSEAEGSDQEAPKE